MGHSLCAPPGGKAGLNDLHAQLGVEVANAQQLRPHANWLDTSGSTPIAAHMLMELRPKLWALPDLLPARHGEHCSTSSMATHAADRMLAFATANFVRLSKSLCSTQQHGMQSDKSYLCLMANCSRLDLSSASCDFMCSNLTACTCSPRLLYWSCMRMTL